MKNIIIVAVIAVLGVGAYYYLTQNEEGALQAATYENGPYTFETAGGGSATISYSEDADKARLTLEGVTNETYELNRARSASGAKYESDDGSIVFWEHQGEATVTIDGDPVLEHAARVEVLKSNKQGDPDANKYDGVDQNCNEVDDDCNGPEGESAFDDDDDNDSLPTGDEDLGGSASAGFEGNEAAAENEATFSDGDDTSSNRGAEAQDHNASRSNTTSSASAPNTNTESAGYMKIEGVEGETSTSNDSQASGDDLYNSSRSNKSTTY